MPVIHPFSDVNVLTYIHFDSDLLEIKIYLEEVINGGVLCVFQPQGCVFLRVTLTVGLSSVSGKPERKSSGQVGPLTRLNSLRGGGSPSFEIQLLN